MLDRIRFLGWALGNLGTATLRLVKAFIIGHEGRCYFCGGERKRVTLYPGHRWEDVTDGQDVIWICPRCEPSILRQVIADVAWHTESVGKSES
jgi:hypothetical protein